MVSKVAMSLLSEIKECINENNNFILKGGAGSGKTYSLIQTINYIYEKDPNSNIYCLTFTNTAVDEIKERTQHKNLKVSTIHNFLWNSIKNYQKEINESLVKLINQDSKKNTRIKYKRKEEIGDGYFSGIEIKYKEYKKIKKGVISHDEVLKISSHMFEEYPLLVKIIRGKLDYIFVDEYQDTDKKVVDILLNNLNPTDDKLTIGFFGDSMQSIYGNSIGDLEDYRDGNFLVKIPKNGNYRSSREVIDLINQIRNDGLKQVPKGEEIIDGGIKFLYSNQEVDIASVKKHQFFNNWSFENYEEVKELYLTHRLASKRGGFKKLFEAYKDSSDLRVDYLLKKDEGDKLTNFLHKIQNRIYLYETNQVNEFIRKTEYNINYVSDKRVLKESIEKLSNTKEKTIEQVINFADEKGIVKKDDSLNSFIEKHKEDYNRIKEISYSEFRNAYMYKEDLTPFTTQHNTKGDEFKNVFVVLDNGGWYTYNFKYLFKGRVKGKESIINRTRKLFYVTCSRAKENLAVYYQKPDQDVINQAREWFGDNNVIEIDN